MDFVPFITAGFPNETLFKKILFMLEEEGAKMIEIGVPYSDPLADGPTIQRTSLRAIEQGITLSKIFDIIKEVRATGLTASLILFTYYNPLLQMGLEKATEQMMQGKLQGVLVPDLPFEESPLLKSALAPYHIPLISLITPTTPIHRRNMLAKQADGFVYIVSSLGVTGERSVFHQKISSLIHEVKEVASVPVVLGFGIKQRSQIEDMANVLDGYVIGSALLRRIEEVENQVASDNISLSIEEYEDRYVENVRQHVKEMQV